MGFLDRILSSTTKLHSGVANTPDTRLFEPQELAHLPGRLVTSTGPAATQTSNVCEHCGCRLEMGIDHNELVCSECGIASRSVACCSVLLPQVFGITGQVSGVSCLSVFF